MQIKGYKGGEKFSAPKEAPVKIDNSGQGFDPDDTLSAGGSMDLDDIWNDDGLKTTPKEEPKDESLKDIQERGDDTNEEKGNEGQEEEKGLLEPEKIIEALLANGEKFPVSASAKIPVTIRGEEHFVDLQEIVNNYSGTTDFHNLYNGLNRERQIFQNNQRKFQETEKAWNEFAKSISDRIGSGKPEQIMDAWEDLVSKAGVDPGQFTHHLVKALLPSIQRYSTMSPEEQSIYDRQVELDARERAYQRSEKKRLADEDARNKDAFVSNIQKEVEEKNQAFGFSMQDFDKGFNFLQDMQRKGDLHLKDIEPLHVYAYLFKEKAETQAKELMKKTAPEAFKDKAKQAEFVKYVTKHVLADYWQGDLQGAKEYETLATEYLKRLTAKEVSRKAEKNPEVIIRKKGVQQSANGKLKTTKGVSSEDLPFDKAGRIQW